MESSRRVLADPPFDAVFRLAAATIAIPADSVNRLPCRVF